MMRNLRSISSERTWRFNDNRSFWTKYCLLCTMCGSAATILAAIFLVVAALFRYYTTSVHYFESVPTYIPAILLSICGVSTIAFSCKRNRNIILLRITACWSLCSAALCSVITITTSLIHMNRLQTLKECVYTSQPPACSCYSQLFPISPPTHEGMAFIFENTPDCDVIHGILYTCLRAVFALSVVSVLLSIFLCILLYQLIGHERKKAYWSRIRRINSDWSTDFIACLSRERSSMLPLVMSGSTSGLMGPGVWGPPPPYEEVAPTFVRPPQMINPHPLSLRLPHSQSSTSEGLLSPHPFSPTITCLLPMDGSSLLRDDESSNRISDSSTIPDSSQRDVTLHSAMNINGCMNVNGNVLSNLPPQQLPPSFPGNFFRESGFSLPTTPLNYRRLRTSPSKSIIRTTNSVQALLLLPKLSAMESLQTRPHEEILAESKVVGISTIDPRNPEDKVSNAKKPQSCLSILKSSASDAHGGYDKSQLPHKGCSLPTTPQRRIYRKQSFIL